MKEKQIGIYCIENSIDNKKYIGQSIDIKRRWKEHKKRLNHNSHENNHLQNAWNKYGCDVFNFNIIQLCLVDELDLMECYYIDLYHTTNRDYGYNLEFGGNLNKTISEETRQKLSESHKGKHLSEEARRKVGEANRGKFVSEETRQKRSVSMKGRTITEEHKQKISESKKGYVFSDGVKQHRSKIMYNAWQNEEYRQKMITARKKSNYGGYHIYCIELDQSFNSIGEASRIVGVSKSSIQKVLYGERKHAGVHPITGEKLSWVKLEK